MTVVEAHASVTSYGDTVVVGQTVTVAGLAEGFSLAVLLPDGWSYLNGDAGYLEWVWRDIPAKPLVFTYVLRRPPSAAALASSLRH